MNVFGCKAEGGLVLMMQLVDIFIEWFAVHRSVCDEGTKVLYDKEQQHLP
jgi:hypothetical protein